MKSLTKKKVILGVLVLGILLLLGSWKIFEWNEFKIRTLDTKNVETIDQNYTYNIDSIHYSKKLQLLTIKGWIVLNGRATKKNESMIQVVLKDSSKYYILPTQQVTRTDVTDYMKDHKNYDESGFYVNCPGKKGIDLEHQDYDVYILIERNNKQSLMSLNTSIKEWKKANAVVKR